MCLWSLASMRTKVVRVIKVLQKQISAKLPELSEREMALTLWSYATLDHHPGSFMDSAAQEAWQRLSKFKPQVIEAPKTFHFVTLCQGHILIHILPALDKQVFFFMVHNLLKQSWQYVNCSSLAKV